MQKIMWQSNILVSIRTDKISNHRQLDAISPFVDSSFLSRTFQRYLSCCFHVFQMKFVNTFYFIQSLLLSLFYPLSLPRLENRTTIIETIVPLLSTLSANEKRWCLQRTLQSTMRTRNF